MSKLFKLREWLTIPEAAKYLSGIFEEEVTEADVLRLALDGHLELSANFVNNATAVGSRVMTKAEWKSLIDKDFILNDEVVALEGVWELVMHGDVRRDIERAYQNLSGWPPVASESVNMVIVHQGDENMFRLVEPRCDFNLETWCYYWIDSLPKDSVLVVRIEVLREFEQSVAQSDNKNIQNVKESTRKTENLLRALTAIAIDDYGYDPESSKSNAPQDIANAMSNQGISFDAKTIRNWLKEGAALLPPKRDKN